MKLTHILDVYQKQLDNLRRTRGWGKPIILRQYGKQFKNFDKDEIETLDTYLKEERNKWFVADLLNTLESFPVELLMPMLFAAIKESNPSLNNEFIRPCRRVFGYIMIQEILLKFLIEGNDNIKIGVLKALYWARPTVYSSKYAHDGENEIKKGRDRFLWSEDLKVFEEEFEENLEIYNNEQQKQQDIQNQQLLSIMKIFTETDNLNLKYQIGLRLPKELDDYPTVIKPQAKLFLQKKQKDLVPRNISELDIYKNTKHPILRNLMLLIKRFISKKGNITLKQR